MTQNKKNFNFLKISFVCTILLCILLGSGVIQSHAAEGDDSSIWEEIERLDAQLNIALSKTDSNAADISALAQTISEIRTKLETLQTTSLSHATQQQLAKLEESLEAADNTLASRIDDLAADLTNKYKQTQQNSADIAALADNIDELEELITALQSTSLSHATQQQLAKLVETLEAADNILADKIERLEADLANKYKQTQQNSADIAALASDIADIEELITALQTTSNSHATQQQLAKLEESLKAADNTLQYQLDELEQLLSVARGENSMNASEIAALASDIADIEELITALQTASLSHTTKQQLDTLQKELNASISALDGKLTQLTSQLQSARTSINANSDGISTLAEEITDIEEVITALQTASLSHTTKQQLEDLKSEVNESILALQNELTKLKSELEQATANVSDNSSSITQLSNSIATLQEAISTLESKAANYVTAEQLDSLKKDLNTAIGILDNKIASNEMEFNNKITRLTNQLHEQQKDFETYLIIIVSVVIACNLALVIWIVVIKKKHLISKNQE